MGKTTGFKEFKREILVKQPPEVRVQHFKEFDQAYDEEIASLQGARCMECGIPFCHGDTGCPLSNLIPDFNDMVYKGHWREALNALHSTNNFPEFTGRLCPAPCESACTLGLIESPVSIKSLERTIIDRGFSEGWIEPRPPKKLTGKRVAIIGSGPAGLAAAQQLARAGHKVTLYEKNRTVGGLMRYGIPDFKLEKWVIERRVEQMKIEGVDIRTGVHVGVDISVNDLMVHNDAIVLAVGSEKPRDLPLPGRPLNGVYYAMEYLTSQNRFLAGEMDHLDIDAKGKHVVVIGGGDTGSDCVGIANRQGAASVTQLEIFPKPPVDRPDADPWPMYPRNLKTSTSHEEGVERLWGVSTKEFIGNNGHVASVRGNSVRFEKGKFADVPDSHFELKADLVFLAMGFVNPVKDGLLEQLQDRGLQFDDRGNVKTFTRANPGTYETAVKHVYAAGDCRRGQSLIVWAIAEGRKCAAEVHNNLMAGQPFFYM